MVHENAFLIHDVNFGGNPRADGVGVDVAHILEDGVGDLGLLHIGGDFGGFQVFVGIDAEEHDAFFGVGFGQGVDIGAPRRE